MNILDRLKNLVDIDIDIGNRDIKNINIKAESDENPLSISEDGEELVIDVNALDNEKVTEVEEIIGDAYDSQGKVLEHNSQKELTKIEQTDTNRIEETLDYFGPKISNEHLEILEKALYLRERWQRNSSVTKQKEDIMEKYGQEGRSITNLCTAGYFDEDRYLRELYNEMRDSGYYKEGDYREEFEEIIRNEPFSVFVSRGDSVKDTKIQIESRLRKYKKYGVRVKFIDVRGIGPSNIETIESTIEILEEELENIDYSSNNDEDGQYQVRIDPESVEWQESDQTDSETDS